MKLLANVSIFTIAPIANKAVFSGGMFWKPGRKSYHLISDC